jgi:hypothetical protein
MKIAQFSSELDDFKMMTVVRKSGKVFLLIFLTLIKLMFDHLHDDKL